MNPDIVIIAGAGLSAVGYVVGVLTARCSADSPCPKCSFHVNERRMKAMRAQEAREAEAHEQERLAHEFHHKGAGWRDNDPDLYDCPQEDCNRNAARRTMREK